MHEYLRSWLKANAGCTSNLWHAVEHLLAEYDETVKQLSSSQDEIHRIRIANTIETPDEEVEDVLEAVEGMKDAR